MHSAREDLVSPSNFCGWIHRFLSDCRLAHQRIADVVRTIEQIDRVAVVAGQPWLKLFEGRWPKPTAALKPEGFDNDANPR